MKGIHTMNEQEKSPLSYFRRQGKTGIGNGLNKLNTSNHNVNSKGFYYV